MSKPVVISDQSKQPDHLSPSDVTRDRLGLVALSAIFLLAAGLRLWFNLATQHSDIAFSCDAAEYLRNAQALQNLAQLPHSFWEQCGSCFLGAASSQTAAQVHRQFLELKDFFISGPIFPLYLLSCFALTGAACSFSNWAAPVAVQSLLTAASCVLIALIGSHAWSRRIGLVAGLTAAIYPSFILNSGRFYSESFACFLLCLTAWLTVRGFFLRGNPPWALFLTGITMMSLQLTRSIMFVISLVIMPITFWQNRSRRPWLALFIVLAGCAMIALPWLGLQQLAFGKGGLIVDRVAHYNFFTGNNPNTQGWLSFPYPDGTGADKKSFLQLTKESVRTSPSRWMKLMLDKPVRLFKFPWNDFRTSIGPLDEYAQVLIHQLLLLFAAAGLIISFIAQPGIAPTRGQLASRTFLFGLLLFQFVYMAFITVPRYNLTAMPMVILFAAAGLVSLIQLIKRRTPYDRAIVAFAALSILFWIEKSDILPLILSVSGASHLFFALTATSLLKVTALLGTAWAIWRLLPLLSGNLRLARIGLILLTLLLMPSLCLPLRAHGRWWEWRCMLREPGQKVTQEIILPSAKLPELRNRQCYLMIDGNGWQPLNSSIILKINGAPVKALLIPNLPFLQDLTQLKHLGINSLFLEGEYIFECLTYAAGISNLDLRQWFLIPIPPELLQNQKAGQPLTVELDKAGGPAVPLFGAYHTSNSYLEVPDPALYSWEKAFYGVENDCGFTDTCLDTKLTLPIASSRTDDLSADPGLPCGELLIRFLVAPPAYRQSETHLTSLSHQLVAPTISTTGTNTTVSTTIGSLPGYSQSDCWLVRISGQVTGQTAPLAASLHITANSRTAAGLSYHYDSPWAPRKITSAEKSTNFDIAFPLVPAAMPGLLNEFTLTCQQLNREAKFPEHTNSTPQAVHFSNVYLDLYRLPSLPMNPGHYIL